MIRAAPAQRLPTALGALLLAAALGLLPAARADAPVTPATRARAALARLASPLAEDRRAAVAELVDLLPGSRSLVVEALPRAPWSVQVHMIEVLSHDGSPEALQALLGHLVGAEATQAALIQGLLAEDPAAGPRLLARWRHDPEAFLAPAGGSKLGVERLQALVRLLRRAEIEQVFLARKSKTGSTGYYKGQYDVLRGAGLEAGYREHALEVVTGIALDDALAVPGVYTSGVYRFLRPHHVDEWELKAMALNAVAELCTRDDVGVMRRIELRRRELLGEREERYARMQERYYRVRDWDERTFQDLMQDWEDSYGEYLDVLACLHQIDPDRYTGLVRSAIEELEGMGGIFVLYNQRGYIAAMLIRVGWYQEALDAYRDAMDAGGTSRAVGCYNMACAAASWSRQAGLASEEREEHLDDAGRYLREAVLAGWSDLEWMNEDRDLDPVREHRRNTYDQVVEVLKAKWHAPPELEKPKR